MIWPWTRRRVEHEAFLAALQAVVDITRAQTQAVEASLDVVKAHYAAYQVQGTPSAHAHDDLSEVLLDRKKADEAFADSILGGMSEVERLKWLATQMDFDPLRSSPTTDY